MRYRRLNLPGFVSELSISRAVLLLLALGALEACQDGYPIEATDCDRWCHVTEPPACRWMRPAECVVECEEFRVVPAEGECRSHWEAALGCLQTLSTEEYCYHYRGMPHSESTPCRTEYEAILDCRYRTDESSGGT